MDWKQILSLSNENLADERKEEIYNELIKDQKFDSKVEKKLFPLCLNILKYKGQQVEKQREEIELLASSDIDLKTMLEQIDKQKKLLGKYDAERAQQKAKIKELSDEMALMQAREMQGSDEDSPDQLSELDKQHALMRDISAKNTHIKKLLRDLEKNEQEAAAYLNVIKTMKTSAECATQKISQLETELSESIAASAHLEEKHAELTNRFMELEQQNQQLLKEREERDAGLQEFAAQCEQRWLTYKARYDEEHRRAEAWREKYESLAEQVPGMDVDGVEIENKRLMNSSKEKDAVMRLLDEKIQRVSAELMDATETIKKMIVEREELTGRLARNKTEKCCEQTLLMLERSNERNLELQEMLDKADEDNILKSKQAFEAIEALKSYENNTDGLANALKKIHQLQETIHQRDKEIREFVVEVNAQNEIVAENSVLRRRLGIPEDEMVETKAFLAKQKRNAKHTDRLQLKLRASEEMRLQLKLDKHDLKKRINALEARVRKHGGEFDDGANQSRVSSASSEKREEMRQCRNCSVTYNVYDSLKYCRNCMTSQNLCESCTTHYKLASTENIELIKRIAKLEIDHQSVVEENENLRDGLNEILEKIRDYDHPIVNPGTLEKLLFILNISSRVAEAAAAPSTENPPTSTNQPSDAQKRGEVEEVTELKRLIRNLSDENDAMKQSLQRMDRLQALYEELVRSSELSDDEKHQLLVKSLERCYEFETNLQSYARKIDFLVDENDKLHREMKHLKVSSLELVNDLRMEILSKSEEMLAIDMHDGGTTDDVGDISAMEQELQRVRLQLNGLYASLLKNIKSLDSENIIDEVDKDKISQVTVIEDNLSTTFITRAELDALKSSVAKMRETISACESRARHLEELANIGQHQLKAQQLMLSKFSEDEVTTRHLIVDLQSRSNDNYLLTKTTRELAVAKENEDKMRLEHDRLKSELIILEERLLRAHSLLDERMRAASERESGNLLKISFLKKTLLGLCKNYSAMTPAYLIADFISIYSALLEAKKQFELSKTRSQSMPEESHDTLIAQLREMSMTDIEAKIEIIKYRSSCDYLKRQLELRDSTITELHNEIARIKISEVSVAQHWTAIRMLFDDEAGVAGEAAAEEKVKFDKETQVDVMRSDCGTNTDAVQLHQQEVHIPTQAAAASENTPVSPPAPPPLSPQNGDEQNSLEIQLKKALSLASSRSSLLIETENRLSEAQGRIKALEKNLESQKSREADLKQHQQAPDQATPKTEDHIFSISIATLQSLIVEKDGNISRYQEMLKAERQQNSRTFDEINEQMKQLRRAIDSHENTIDERNKLIEKLKATVADLSEKLVAAKKRPPTPDPPQHRGAQFDEGERESMEAKLKEAHTEIKRMEQQIKDLTNTERLLQNNVHDKEVTIKELNIKLKATSDNLETLSENITSASPEIDSLRDMLEEKDRHIQELTETLNQFHDDQQRYITDTALNSVEQATYMSANLSRSETKIRVLETQLDAMKRQVGNLQQREKNSRDLIKTLKDQLIRRPVISVKSDKRTCTPREEQQQKRITELENELLEAKDELRRQININDNKKAKNAAELGLWDKQKRYQELSEKLKAKLTEKEIDLDRLKANYQMAKNTIKRLENEKLLAENRLKSGQYLQKYQHPSNAPCQSCTTRDKGRNTPSAMSDISDFSRDEMISALRSRIESLHRRNIVLELDNKGTSAMAQEYEKLQEKLSKTEAKVMRLESTNAQLHVEIDLARQSSSGKNQEDKIKHLEDYIMVLKEEVKQVSEARDRLLTAPKSRVSEEGASAKIRDMEQTILNLKQIVEKLHAENKYLRNAKNRAGGGSSSIYTSNSTPATPAYMSASDRKKEEVFEKLKTEYEKLQKSYSELLSKNSSLQIELELSQVQTQTITASCPHCDRKNLDELAGQDIESLRNKLLQREMLLQKAKMLVSRSLTKQRQLSDKVISLKKRICELEGVPVISEENSENSVS